MIGGLQYLTHTRPDIENAIGIISRFQVDPIEAHYAIVKMIFTYLKGKSNLALWYDKPNDFTLSTYTDVDWEGNMDDKKSNSDEAFFLGGISVSWLRKK